MNENVDSNELEPLRLSKISIEQGKILVRRIEKCLKENPKADLFVLLDFGAAPLEIIMREFTPDLNLDIQHIRLDRDSVRKMGSFSVKELQEKLGKSNTQYLQAITSGKEHIVVIDDIEYEGKTLNLAELVIKSVNSKCEIVKFPIIKSSQYVLPGSDAWPFALFDDVGMVSGYRMPWEVDQNKFVGRIVDRGSNMRTIPVENPDYLAISLRSDLQSVSKYFKNGGLS